MKSKSKLIKRIFIGVIGLLVVIIAGFLIYVNDYYRASDDVDIIISEYSEIIETSGRYTIIYPSREKNLNTGLIFYPGGKVEAKAYIPLLLQIADQGITAVLVDMPFNLAVFNINAANQVLELVDTIDDWYLAGHSLGGAMASSYVNNHADKLQGLILLAAYPINDASLNTIQIYGTHDLVLDQEKLVSNVSSIEIDGGNHAFFGHYGLQKGDGVATISRKQQQAITVTSIIKFMGLTIEE